MVRRITPPRRGVLDAIGQTPLVRLERYLGSSNIKLYAKLEAANPGGSAKDRPAREMIEQALARGDIDANSTIVESTSGNMGIGLAQTCRYYGLRLICVVDPKALPQNIAIMRALGAEIDWVTTPLDGDFLAARLARVCWLLEHTPGSYWPNQYSNLDNPRAHEQGAIREIDEELQGDFDYVLVATSSTGTALGCYNYLQSVGHPARVIAVDAAGSVLFGGSAGPRQIPGMGAGRESRLARNGPLDQVVRVTDLDCVVGCRRLALREAVLAGGSSGGVLEACRRCTALLQHKTCVAILHDSGTRYLETVYNDGWVEEQLGVPAAQLAQMVEQDAADPAEAYC